MQALLFLKYVLKSLFLVLIDVKIPLVIQSLSLNRFFFLNISRKGACLSRVELNTVVRVETSWGGILLNFCCT